MNKEFGSTLCDKLSHMVWEGEKAAAGGYTGEVVYESHLVPPVLEPVLMKRGDVMIVQGWTYDCFSPYVLMR